MRPNPVDSSDIVYSTCWKSQTASIAILSMYQAPSSSIANEKGALVRVSAYLLTTVAGSAGTCLLTISWTDDAGAKTLATSTIALNTLGSHQILNSIFEVAEDQLIQFSTTVASAAGSPQYMIVLVLERLK